MLDLFDRGIAEKLFVRDLVGDEGNRLIGPGPQVQGNPCEERRADRIEAVPAVPRTLSGKKLEVPIKRMLQGTSTSAGASRDSLANPEALDWFASASGRGDLA